MAKFVHLPESPQTSPSGAHRVWRRFNQPVLLGSAKNMNIWLSHVHSHTPPPSPWITDAHWKKNTEEKPSWPQLKKKKAWNSSSRGIKSTPRPLSASPPSPFCGLTCLIDHAFSPHCRPVTATMFIFGTPISEAFDLRTERNKVMETRRWYGAGLCVWPPPRPSLREGKKPKGTIISAARTAMNTTFAVTPHSQTLMRNTYSHCDEELLYPTYGIY